MHSFITNASIQLVPIVQDRHPYEWIDEVIPIIQGSGLTYSVGPFGTSVEGTYPQISSLIDQINDYLYRQQCPEWLLNVQWQIRGSGNVTMEEKVKKV